MFFQKILWLFVGLSELRMVLGFQMNLTQYYQMPQLYDFANYDRCLYEFQNGDSASAEQSTYCFVRAEIQAKNNSNIWQIIIDISKYYNHHFDHRHLYFGICMRECKAELSKLDANSTKKLFAGILTDNQKVNVYLDLFAKEQQNRLLYNRLTNVCINLRLQQYDGLQAKSVVEYCDTNQSKNKNNIDDAWNLLFSVIVYILIVLTILSSFIDLMLKTRHHDKLLKARDHYKTSPKFMMQQVFVTFSIARNWYRLNQLPNGKIGRELRFLDCFKFFAMFLVIFAHTNWVIYESAISNPQDPERLLHTPVGTLLISGALITVTFFVISGLLLTLTWLAVVRHQEEQKQQNFSLWQYSCLFVKFNLFRYIRLTVPYGFAILLSGVYFDNAGGPLWRHIMEREQLACRKNWWTNLLYLNNFINTNERCLLQGWYLAADTHSFVLSLLILMIGNRFPKWRKHLFGTVLAIFIILPAALTYALDYYPLFLPTPQTQKDSFIDDRQFNEFYTAFYMNFGCYFFGVITALIYDQLSSQQNYKLRDNKLFQVVWYTLIPIAFMWLLSAHPLFQYYYKEIPLFWGSIYAGLQRNIWAFGLGIFIIGSASKVGWIIRKFCCLPIFRILGRLTYGAFILHLLIARVVLSTIRSPIYFGTGMMFAFIFFTVTMSYLCAFILAIFLELPVSSFLKLMR